jgi:MATE family multidrug resistance protein
MADRLISVQRQFSDWWHRPAGGRVVVHLALPLVLSTASWTLMHFVDRVLLTWYSTEAIAAVMPSGLLHFTLVCLPMGMTSYVNTFVAQYHGAGRPDRIGAITWQGIWIGLVTVPLFLLLIPISPWMFSLFGHAPSMARLESDYFEALAYGGGATVIAAAQAAFFTGLGRTRVVMVADMVVAVVNMVLDYILIFGIGFIPEYGVSGAGWATAIAQISKVVLLAIVMSWKEFRIPYNLVSQFHVERSMLRRLVWFGGPSGIQMMGELMAFTAFTFLVGQLGEAELAATTIAFSVNSIAFVPMFGLGIAVSTMVGQQIGAGHPDLAARATWTSIWLGCVYTGFMALLYLAVPDLFLLAHAAGGTSDFEQLRAICRVLLRFVAAYCVLDMMQIVFSSAIKGAGDTRFVLLTTILVSPVPVIVGWFGLHRWGWGLGMFWGVITAWISLMALIYFVRFHLGAWRKMTVLEREPVVTVLHESSPTAAALTETLPE